VQPWPYQHGKPAEDFKTQKQNQQATSTNYEAFLQGDNQKYLQRQPQMKLASVPEVVISILPKVYSTTAGRIISEHSLQEPQFTQKSF
jgi:hypothetical protein